MTGILTAMHAMHKAAATAMAFIYASVSTAPSKSILVSINTAGEYTFTFGMTLMKYVKSTETPVHRVTPV